MFYKAHYQSPHMLKEHIDVAQGIKEADLVIKNVTFLDVFGGTFQVGDVAIYQQHIVGIKEIYHGKKTIDGSEQFLVPGFIDSHVHIESSLMTPRRYEESVLPRGTTSAIWDPHEIANVKGEEGIEWAYSCADKLLMDIFIMLPSCVPSTCNELALESSGAELRAEHLRPYINHPLTLGLAEMMNYPGLLAGDTDIMEKLHDFNSLKRDGHCPGLLGKELNAYGAAGIHSCHESTSLEEAKEKLSKGIHTLIREGSCAKNSADLLPIITDYSSAIVSLCSDDRNPADIENEGHIDFIINKALKSGIKAENIFRTASFSAAKTYGLEDRGAIAPGYIADLCLINQKSKTDWSQGFYISKVLKSGEIISGPCHKTTEGPLILGKNLNLEAVNAEKFAIKSKTSNKDKTCKVNAIELIPEQIISKFHQCTLKKENQVIEADLDQDILKITVLERHKNTGRIGLGFVKGFNIKIGAIATSINHDSHNIIAVGANDAAISAAVNQLIKIDGGIVVWEDEKNCESLALPIGGLMTDSDPESVSHALKKLKHAAKNIGCKLHEPFLQLSFLALPVIGHIKITDRGLVDVDKFRLIDVEM